MGEPKLSQTEKSIFEYDNYRSYLKDTYDLLKTKDKNFSFRYFARVAGFSSGSFLKLVMDGKSNLSLESIAKFSKAFKHNKEQAAFFRSLVFLNQATDSEEKKIYADEILKSRAYRKIHPLSEPLYHYFSRWYFVVLKEMVELADFREDYDWIAAKLHFQVTVSELKHAVEEMIALGILGRDADGTLIQRKSFIMSADEIVSGSAAEFHREMMRKASDAIDRVPREKRELSALTIGVSRETAVKIKRMIQDFRKEIMSVCTEDSSPESIYQVNLHLFPLVASDNEES